MRWGLSKAIVELRVTRIWLIAPRVRRQPGGRDGGGNATYLLSTVESVLTRDSKRR